MKIQTRTVLSRLLLPLIATASLLSATSAYSAIMTVEMTGFISGKSFLSATSVQVGDTFGLTFNYDDSLQTSRLYYANGRTYTVTDQPFSTVFSGWWGTLPQEIAMHDPSFANGGSSGWGNAWSIFESPTTLNHTEWRITGGGSDFLIVTNFKENLGYGWWAIASEAYGAPVTAYTIDKGYCSSLA
jgi:hypothetical protein